MASDEMQALQARIDTLERKLAELIGAQRTPVEITVERINIVESDGTLRMVISNKDRAPDGVINGKVLQGREGGNESGIIFYNNEGDECGGLIYSGKREADGTYVAGGSLTFDQFKQDQVVQLMHEDANGQRIAGLFVVDRPDMPLDEWAERCMPVFNLPDGPEKEAAFTKLRDEGLMSAHRVFVGKDRGAAAVVLRDAQNRTRIRLEVAADGTPKLEVPDERGNVTDRVPG